MCLLAAGVLCEHVWEQISGCRGSDSLQEADSQSSDGKGAKGHGDSPLCFVCSNANGSMLRLGRVRIIGVVGPLHWEEGSGLMPCLILVVGTG